MCGIFWKPEDCGLVVHPWQVWTTQCIQEVPAWRDAVNTDRASSSQSGCDNPSDCVNIISVSFLFYSGVHIPFYSILLYYILSFMPFAIPLTRIGNLQLGGVRPTLLIWDVQ